MQSSMSGLTNGTGTICLNGTTIITIGPTGAIEVIMLCIGDTDKSILVK